MPRGTWFFCARPWMRAGFARVRPSRACVSVSRASVSPPPVFVILSRPRRPAHHLSWRSFTTGGAEPVANGPPAIFLDVGTRHDGRHACLGLTKYHGCGGHGLAVLVLSRYGWDRGLASDGVGTEPGRCDGACAGCGLGAACNGVVSGAVPLGGRAAQTRIHGARKKTREPETTWHCASLAS